MSRQSLQTHVTLWVQLPGQKSPGDGHSLPEPLFQLDPLLVLFPQLSR